MADAPQLIVLAGPNGAGKSTSAPRVLAGVMNVVEYVNADVIARGLSGFDPDRAALQAGRVALQRLKDLAAIRADFAFETTLATRSFATWFKELRQRGYAIHIIYFWLPSVDAAVARVSERVRRGGHHIPEETIRSRYISGLRNLFDLYVPLVTSWRLYDNSSLPDATLIARGAAGGIMDVVNPHLWKAVVEVLHDPQS